MFRFKDLSQFALLNNGRVVTREITFLKKCKSIRFECQIGHQWEVVTHKALHSLWCPECNGNKPVRNTIELMRQIAADRNGRCLSEKYINSESKLEWECEKGHRWFANSHGVKNKGTWCKLCKNEAQKNSIEDMHKLAEKRGGKCLSKKYILNNVPLKWQCSEGHIWENQPSNITMGQWCPVCSKNDEKLTLLLMQEVAIEGGGKCLSRIYIDSGTKLEW